MPPTKTKSVSKDPAAPKKRKRVAAPFFKRALTEIALEAGLKRGPTELQLPRTSLSNMLLHVPLGTSMLNKVLAFLRLYNIRTFAYSRACHSERRLCHPVGTRLHLLFTPVF